MINTYDTTNIEIKFLQSLKKNHKLTNRQIAKRLNATESAVSRWLNNKSIPTKESKDKIYKLLNEEWRPGIVRFSATKGVWGEPYYLRVMDVLAPYDTWIDIEWSGNDPEDFPQMIKKWEENCGKNYQIMLEYPDYETFCKKGRKDETIYNCTQELYVNRPEAAYTYDRPWEIAWDLIKEFENEKT